MPSGGHVEVNEHPQDTVKRECVEELGIDADFIVEYPVFISVTDVNDQGIIHTDISLWYVLYASEDKKLNFCPSEYNTIKWFDFYSIPYTKTDQNMMRFVNKLLNIF